MDCEGNCRPGGKLWQPTAGFMTHVTCRLTAKNRDQRRNPSLGTGVWATVFIVTMQLSTPHRHNDGRTDHVTACSTRSVGQQQRSRQPPQQLHPRTPRPAG